MNVSITKAANLLEISEHDLFKRAYHEWNGWEDSQATKDFSKWFRGGSCQGPIPHYVNHFIRHYKLEA